MVVMPAAAALKARFFAKLVERKRRRLKEERRAHSEWIAGMGGGEESPIVGNA